MTHQQSNTAVYHYMREFADYLDDGMDFPELSQIRQLDASLQEYYRRAHNLVEQLRTTTGDQSVHSQSQAETQSLLIDALVQAKILGDKKMQLTQQILDATERQSKKLQLTQQKYLESINQQPSLPDNTSNKPNDISSDHESDSESGCHRPLWPRRTTIHLKRKCVLNSEQSVHERERKRPAQRPVNSSVQLTNNGNGKKQKSTNDAASTQSDETTYCLCSQLSYGSMILCDSKTCDIKWFHFNCVNLNTKPKGKWFCPSCRE